MIGRKILKFTLIKRCRDYNIGYAQPIFNGAIVRNSPLQQDGKLLGKVYLGTNDWNQGRTQEIKERVVHLGQN